MHWCSKELLKPKWDLLSNSPFWTEPVLNAACESVLSRSWLPGLCCCCCSAVWPTALIPSPWFQLISLEWDLYLSAEQYTQKVHRGGRCTTWFVNYTVLEPNRLCPTLPWCPGHHCSWGDQLSGHQTCPAGRAHQPGCVRHGRQAAHAPLCES